MGFRREVLERLAASRPAAERFGLARHKALLLPLVTFGLLAVLASGALDGVLLVAAEAALVFSCLVAALGIGHDASHAALSERGWVNRLGVFVFDCVGVNGYVWHFDHVTAHHSTPNISRYDANLYGWGPIRLDPRASLRPWHRHQHIYAWLVYLSASLFKVYLGDFLAFARSRVDAYLPRRHRHGDWARLVGFKLASLGLTLALPLWRSGSGRVGLVLTGYLIGHAMNGILMGAVFQPTHTNELVSWPEPDESGAVATSFEAHVLATAADFAVDSPWITWLAGGLNIHAVHHLFPRIPQLDLLAAARVVRDVAPRHGLRYRTFPSWRAALASHHRALRTLGAPAPAIEHLRAGDHLAPIRCAR